MTVQDIIKLNEILNRITEQDVELPIRESYNILKLRNETETIYDLVLDRLYKFFGKDAKFSELNDEENLLFNSIMLSEVYIEGIRSYIKNIDFKSLMDCKKTKLKINDVEFLDSIFQKIEKENGE